ncbi:bifunctional nicotinamidase/pyrazinamidase [Rouxiella sp. Mn2063]|uniref:bifunctional nicotinamidase/pyrazinamidase n=1 Tax=Rouxiella sp. Mn2063 TaxID=3395262 RepID=UPI003BD980A3
MTSALLLIDLQNDFCPGGALAVTEGDQTIAVANQAIAACSNAGWHIVASQDWHPENHRSFAVNSGQQAWTLGELEGLPQVWWPAHCIEQQSGADFHPELNKAAITFVVHKGQNADIDSYSAFFDNGKLAATGLDEWLHQQQITHLVVMGLATDYCVKFSVLDALSLGYQVTLIAEGCRAVNLAASDGEQAILDMQQAGAQIQTLQTWLSTLA